MSFLLEHSTLSFDLSAILSLVLLVGVVAYTIYKSINNKKKTKRLEEELDSLEN